MSAKKIILDCDPGHDDAVAILLALASPKEIELLGITCVAGNVPLDRTRINALRVCELVERTDISVYSGCERPLVRFLVTAEQVHGQTGLDLPDGSTLPVDFVIVGVGILPETALAEASGIAIENGIRTDEMGRTSAPNVWAAGDCASFPHEGRQMRLESVGNAIDQAEAVADNLMGAAAPYVPKPWFWSDQYDVKLQIAGLNTGYDQVVVRAGGDGPVSHWYYRAGQLIALDAMNDPRAFMVGKRLIEAGKSADPAVVGDAGADLKALLRA